MSLLPPLKLALVDDHKLFRKGLISLVEMVYNPCVILFEAENGLDLQRKIDKANLPDIILLDVNMPVVDGFASVEWMKVNYPEVKILVVSMIEKEEMVVRMLKLGVRGYLCKDVEPHELLNALQAIRDKGFYYTDFITGKLVHSLQTDTEERAVLRKENVMNEQEKKFIQLACSEMTYHEIADQMCLSPKTIDGYRSSLFEKLNVKSRVGLVMYAIKHEIVSLS